jgi:hypothetical protein
MTRLLFVLHLVVGVSAVAAGLALVNDPSGEVLSFDTDWLDGSPFPTYFVPGLFLALVNGGLNLGSAYGIARREWWDGVVSLVAGIVLLTWIVVQWAIIGYQHWTQVMWLVVFTTMLAIAVLRWRTRAPTRQLRGV